MAFKRTCKEAKLDYFSLIEPSENELNEQAADMICTFLHKPFEEKCKILEEYN